MQNDVIAELGSLLRGADPTNSSQVAEAEALANAAMSVAMAFVQERHGKAAAALAVTNIFERVAILVSNRVNPGSVEAPISMLEPMPQQATAATIQASAETMFEYLNGRATAEADTEARASIWASAAYLRGRQGEAVALEYLRFIEAKMSMLAWFEQLPVESAARH